MDDKGLASYLSKSFKIQEWKMLKREKGNCLHNF